MSQQDGIDRPPAFPKRLAAALDRVEALERELVERMEPPDIAEWERVHAERDALKARVVELEAKARAFLTGYYDPLFPGWMDACLALAAALETTGDDNAKG